MLTADQIVAQARILGNIPEYPASISTDLLTLADLETETVIVPMIMSLREEFFVKQITQALTASTSEYVIPYRAVGRKLRDIHFVSSGGTENELTRISMEYAYEFTNVNSSGDPRAVYFVGDSYTIVPTVGTAPTGSLKLWYYLRPSKLTLVANCAKITAINTVTGQISCASVPSGITTATAVDLVAGRSGNSCLNHDVTITNISSNIITIAPGDVPSRLAVGDYISLAETTPVPQIPSEMHSALVQAVTVRWLSTQTDSEGKARAMEELKAIYDSCKSLLSQRLEGAPKVIVNRQGLLRTGFRRSFLY